MAQIAPGAKKEDRNAPVECNPGDVPYIYGGCTDVGGRAYQEDRLRKFGNFNTHLPDSVDKSVRRAFFAVFDGHGGHRCSQFLYDRFHVALAAHADIGTDPRKALSETWDTCEEEFIAFCRREHEIRKANNPEAKFPQDGSTATVALCVGNKFYITNVGDSSVVIMRKKQPPWVLSVDHGTANVEENKRIEAAGGELRQQYKKELQGFPFCCRLKEVPAGKPRVYPGGLLVTRAFGDLHAKLPELGGIPNTIVHTHSEIHEVEIDDTWKDLIVASDGVWDAIPLNKIDRLITEEYGDNDPKSSNFMRHIARGLVESSVTSSYWDRHGADADNTTAVILNFDEGRKKK